MRVREAHPPTQARWIPAYHPPRQLLGGAIVVVAPGAIEPLSWRGRRLQMAPEQERNHNRRHADADERSPKRQKPAQTPRLPGCHARMISAPLERDLGDAEEE